MPNLLVREDIIAAIDSVRDRLKNPRHLMWSLDHAEIKSHAITHGVWDMLSRQDRHKRIIDNMVKVTLRESKTSRAVETFLAYIMFIMIDNDDTGQEFLEVVIRYADRNKDAIKWLKDLMGKSELAEHGQLSSITFDNPEAAKIFTRARGLEETEGVEKND